MKKIIAFGHSPIYRLYKLIEMNTKTARKCVNNFFNENPNYLPSTRELNLIKELHPRSLEVIANNCLKEIKDIRWFLVFLDYLQLNRVFHNQKQFTHSEIEDVVNSVHTDFELKKQFWAYLSTNHRTKKT